LLYFMRRAGFIVERVRQQGVEAAKLQAGEDA
jgi:hypothetical protein